jgi:hypothetical protein
MAAYRVTAPYVTLKVRDQAGAWVLTGFYDGAVVSGIDEASLRHHLDNGMLVEVEQPAPAPETEPPSELGDRPKDYASKPEWVDYAVSKRAEGVSEEDARVAAEAKSKADLITEFGG